MILELIQANYKLIATILGPALLALFIYLKGYFKGKAAVEETNREAKDLLTEQIMKAQERNSSLEIERLKQLEGLEKPLEDKDLLSNWTKNLWGKDK